MSVTKSIVTFEYPSGLNINQASHRSQIRISSNSSAKFTSPFWNKEGFKCRDNIWRVKKEDENRRSFVMYSVVRPEAPPPSDQPRFNFLNWIVGVVLTIVLPFFSHKGVPFLKLKNKFETTVSKIEVIVDTVERVAEGVEKAAEHIADELPEGGRLRRAVDFVEHVAERTSKDAHLVGDFIDKVQEAEEKVGACVESMAEEAHENPKEEDRAHQQPRETNNEEHKNY